VLEQSTPQFGQGLSLGAKDGTMHRQDDAWDSDTTSSLSADLFQYGRMYAQLSQETSEYFPTHVCGYRLSS
jgi:hypothetical protein